MLDCCNDVGMTVTQAGHGRPATAVEIAFAVLVVNVDTVAPCGARRPVEQTSMERTTHGHYLELARYQYALIFDNCFSAS